MPRADPRFGLAMLGLVLGTARLAGCGADPVAPPIPEVCSGYGDAAASPYALPYPVGVTWPVWQGNCSGFGHSGFWKYSYDFDMPIGSVVTAARSGTVVYAYGSSRDDGPHDSTARPNLVLIRHADSTVAVYSHLMRNGVRVHLDQAVLRGDTIALSGNTGYTDNHPHLHFSIHGCERLPGFADVPDCPGLATVFVNALPQLGGPLMQGRSYTGGPLSIAPGSGLEIR